MEIYLCGIKYYYNIGGCMALTRNLNCKKCPEEVISHRVYRVARVYISYNEGKTITQKIRFEVCCEKCGTRRKGEIPVPEWIRLLQNKDWNNKDEILIN